jgi:hypothetical protein
MQLVRVEYLFLAEIHCKKWQQNLLTSASAA